MIELNRGRILEAALQTTNKMGYVMMLNDMFYKRAVWMEERLDVLTEEQVMDFFTKFKLMCKTLTKAGIRVDYEALEKYVEKKHEDLWDVYIYGILKKEQE
jgi:hypothetical protein